MGDFNIRPIQDNRDRAKMYAHAINDIQAFESLLEQERFESGAPKIGLEQELCVVDSQLEPAKAALDILDDLQLKEYTNELALFNLEINGDPLDLKGNCFSEAERSLLSLLKAGISRAKDRDLELLLCGILPTLQYRHLAFSYMTPIQRYQVLSKMLADIRGDQFEIYLQGVDELIMSLESVLFEACNTSFQLHLQIAPKEFVRKYNWAQMIAGPVLAACTNSPLLFGRELWSETRIALFKQSLDTRSSRNHLRKKLPRVYFGHDWLRHSPAELWKNELMRFPLLLTSDDFQDATQVLQEGKTPNLRAIRLHNGTTYTWNRLCYGPQGTKPHLRIECRYLPSGPTVADEIANFAFWVGLMEGQKEDHHNFWEKTDFRIAKDNFIRTARTGLASVIDWFDGPISAQDLILNKLIPMAKSGLEKTGVDSKDIEHYLGIIDRRIRKQQTGSIWQVEAFRELTKESSRPLALKTMSQQMIQYQLKNTPVSEWDIPGQKESAPVKAVNLHPSTLVEDIMSTDIFIVHGEDSVQFVDQMMQWKNIHHVPVEDRQGNLIGMITDGLITRMAPNLAVQQVLAKDIMITDVITADAKDSLEEAGIVLQEHQLSCLPIVYHGKLVGILTEKDLSSIELPLSTYT